MSTPAETVVRIIERQNEAIVGLDRLHDQYAAEIADLRSEQAETTAELRDEINALANRIEGVHRAALRALNLTTLGEESA